MTIKVICVIDNTVLKDTDLRGEHGLSFWIESDKGVVLFDTGQTASVLSHNMESLGLSPQDINNLVLSHAHYDHTGGLEAILSKNTKLTLHAHTDFFQPRYSLRKGEYMSIGIDMDKTAIEKHAKLMLSDVPTEVYPNLWTTGEITDRSDLEGRSNNHLIKVNDEWKPDPYRDDMSIVLKTSGGLVLICGCCHAGILNTLSHVEQNFKESIHTIIGGTHLVTADGQYMDHVISVFTERYPKVVFYHQPLHRRKLNR
ncbi:MAG: MBL fold metallo-hydrolase [Anaerolineaceae bacterium]|nr:MBL fold metallo-hydrolase [Anaerolineaceae bacterium]MBN2677559.1 MBL fold metallo-hydrolase [Anaerolineaceae bacterium]